MSVLTPLPLSSARRSERAIPEAPRRRPARERLAARTDGERRAPHAPEPGREVFGERRVRAESLHDDSLRAGHELERSREIGRPEGLARVMEQLQLGGEDVLQHRGWIIAQVLEAAAQAERRRGPGAQRLTQLGLERGQSGVAERLRRADDRRIAGVQSRGDLDRREEHDLLAMLREEGGDAILGRTEARARRGDPLLERWL